MLNCYNPALDDFYADQKEDWDNELLNKMEDINMKFRKKPVEIEAVQFRTDTFIEVMDFCPVAKGMHYDEEKGQYYLTIPTLEGEMRASEGDYIIKGVKGEFYPCKPDIFAQTYEPVEDSTKSMMFKQAYEALKQGAKIKRPHWRGFWTKENGTITMHCKDGSVIPFLETEDIFVDLDNVVAEDWKVVEDYDVKQLNITTFTFGEAISNLKRGKKVARKGWNGKGQYIELATSISYVNTRSEIINVEHNDIGNKAIAFVGTSGVQMGWLASQSDMLAEDWIVHEDNGVQQ